MKLLSLNLLLYTTGGVWRPIEWSSQCSKLLYGIFTFFTIYLLIFLTLTHLLDIIVVVDNVEDFSSSFLIFCSVITTLSKSIVAVTRRDQIISIIEVLQRGACKACNEEETDIRTKFDRLIRARFMNYLLLSTVSVLGAVAGGVLDILGGHLPFSVWVPWDCTSPFVFWFTSFQGIAAMILGTIVNAATDMMVFGFCLQICAQLEILKYRLRRLAISSEKNNIYIDSLNSTYNKTNRLSKHIAHHLCIIRLAEVLNAIFSEVIFIQFFGSILILCSMLYYLSSHVTLMDIATMITFVFCMFMQIFVYCWAGNEVTLKSTELGEAAFDTDWLLMTISERKDLLMIMKQSTRPIKFSSGFLVTLSLESFANLLKATYSAFNLMQQS